MMKFSYTSYRQSGVALVVVMIFILILSAIAAFSARRAFLGEGIARSQLDVEIATQAAEAALRDAEIDLRIKDPGLRTGASCDRGESRPIRGATIGNPFFADSCPTGQCRNATGTSHAVMQLPPISTQALTLCHGGQALMVVGTIALRRRLVVLLTVLSRSAHLQALHAYEALFVSPNT
jgi:hypothetical protein